MQQPMGTVHLAWRRYYIASCALSSLKAWEPILCSYVVISSILTSAATCVGNTPIALSVFILQHYDATYITHA